MIRLKGEVIEECRLIVKEARPSKKAAPMLPLESGKRKPYMKGRCDPLPVISQKGAPPK